MSTVKKNDIYVTNFVEQNGGGSGSPIRVITCDAHININWTSGTYGYRGSLDDESARALYEEIFGRPYTGSTDATYVDIANLPAIPIFIKFTNFTLHGSVASSTLFFLRAFASPSDQEDTISIEAFARDISIDIVTL